MPVTQDMLVTELQSLLRLTAFEQSVATVRRVQARSSDIADELKANAEKSGERLALLAAAVRQAGGAPDVVGPLLGKVGAFVQTQLNQVQSLQGALLGDLALEHQLRDRARYARALAETLGYAHVFPVLDRLEQAHTATIAWLETRIDEVGRTGTSALKATPIQSVVTTGRRALRAPFGLASAGINRATGLLQGLGGKQVESATGAAVVAAAAAKDSVKDTVKDTAKAAAGKAGHVADKAADLTQKAADKAAADVYPTEGTVQPAVDEFGAVGSLNDNTGVEPDGVHAPFPGYDKLSGDSVMRHVAESTDLPDLQVLLAYEEAHKGRKGVVQAVEARFAELGAPVS